MSPSSPAARAASAAASSKLLARARRRRRLHLSRARSAGARVRSRRARRAAAARGRGSATSRDEASVAAFFETVDGGARPGRHPGEQRRHRARRARDVLDARAGTRCSSVNLDGAVSLRARRRARHAAAALGPDHQRLVAQRADAAAGQTSYAASKAGLEGLTRALSRDLAAKGVLVNAVSPGLIETEMLEAMPAAARAAHLKAVPIGRARHAARSRGGGGVSGVRRGELHHRPGDRRRRRPAVKLQYLLMTDID